MTEQEMAVNYCFVMERDFYVKSERFRLGTFWKISDGEVKKVALKILPEKIEPEHWAEAVTEVSKKFGVINYILFRHCSRIYGIDKNILPDTVWCDSIADYSNEPTRSITNTVMNNIADLLDKINGGAAEFAAFILKEGIPDVEILI